MSDYISVSLGMSASLEGLMICLAQRWFCNVTQFTFWDSVDTALLDVTSLKFILCVGLCVPLHLNWCVFERYYKLYISPLYPGVMTKILPSPRQL